MPLQKQPAACPFEWASEVMIEAVCLPCGDAQLFAHGLKGVDQYVAAKVKLRSQTACQPSGRLQTGWAMNWCQLRIG